MWNNSEWATAQEAVAPNPEMIAHSLRLMTPFHLCAFPQDGGHGVGKFFGDDVRSGTDFAFDNANRQLNVYWEANETFPDCGIKAKKEQIRTIRFAHLDLDPPKDGSEFDKAAALAAIQSDYPTFVVDSGNGWHAYWRLADPQPATPNTIAEIEGLNRAILAKHGGDAAVWNVDRLLRVPGTINWPNAKKRALGRIPQRVVLL